LEKVRRRVELFKYRWLRVGKLPKCGFRNSNTLLSRHEHDTSTAENGFHRFLLGIMVIVGSYEKLQKCHTPHTGVTTPVHHAPHRRGGWRISVTPGIIFPITVLQSL
jgi:hypothetical protein